MRTIVVGDIHGCNKALQGLLQAIHPTANDQLIFLGDYVDRGPDSRGTIDTLIDAQQRWPTICLLGNHDLMFRSVLNGRPPQLWLDQGGRTTLTSYGGRLDYVSQAHQRFLDQLKWFHEDTTSIFVHANYDAHLPMDQQEPETLLWEHLNKRVPQPHCSGKHVFCGHTPQPRGRVGEFGYFTCLDTACFAGFWLSAKCVESGEIWQVSPHGHLRRDWRLLRNLRYRIVKAIADYRS